jgi:PTS system mannose-specific IIA component
MIGIIVAAHGSLAEALVETARTVVPANAHVHVVSFSDETAQSIEREIAQLVQVYSKANGVLILTDMFGGTPSRIAMAQHKPGSVEILTGVNLPMVIKAIQLQLRKQPLDTVAGAVREYGHRSVAVASEILATAPVGAKRSRD